MTAEGNNYFRRCTDLTSLPRVQTRGLTDAPPGETQEISLLPVCLANANRPLATGTGRHSWRLNPTSPLLSHHHGLCSVPCARQVSPLSSVRSRGGRMVPTSTLCRAALLHSLSQDAFLNSFFCWNGHLNPFFFPQRSRLAQINTNYPSKLSIWMAFRFYSLFQWGTNISSPVS